MKSPLLARKAPYEIIRDAIADQYLKTATQSGGRLPSDRQLADQFGVSIATISKSISSLVSDGLLERRVGSGTYIRNIEDIQQVVGIYLGASTISYASPHLMFYLILDNILQSELNAKGVCQHYADMRIPVSQGTPLRSLQTDAKAGRLSDLIVCRANAADFWWLEQLPTRVIGFGVNLGHSTVEYDLEAFCRSSVAYLKESGCQSVGLISRIPPVKTLRAASYSRFHEAFDESIREAGFPLLPEWLQVFKIDDSKVFNANHQTSEEFGHASFVNLWNAPRRPEGLIVYHDAVGLGVVKAARELGVDLTRDIRTIFHANEENVWPEFRPYPLMAYSIKETALALTGLIGNPRKTVAFVKPCLVLPQGEK